MAKLVLNKYIDDFKDSIMPQLLLHSINRSPFSFSIIESRSSSFCYTKQDNIENDESNRGILCIKEIMI